MTVCWSHIRLWTIMETLNATAAVCIPAQGSRKGFTIPHLICSLFVLTLSKQIGNKNFSHYISMFWPRGEGRRGILYKNSWIFLAFFAHPSSIILVSHPPYMHWEQWVSIPHTATLVQIFKLTRIFSSGQPNRVFQGSAEPPVKGSIRHAHYRNEWGPLKTYLKRRK